MEEKATRFRRVAEKRVNNLLNALRLLGQCSNRQIYEYSPEDIRIMFREIERELRRVKTSFVSVDGSKTFKF